MNRTLYLSLFLLANQFVHFRIALGQRFGEKISHGRFSRHDDETLSLSERVTRVETVLAYINDRPVQGSRSTQLCNAEGFFFSSFSATDKKAGRNTSMSFNTKEKSE
jgi:hypothetical protein